MPSPLMPTSGFGTDFFPSRCFTGSFAACQLLLGSKSKKPRNGQWCTVSCLIEGNRLADALKCSLQGVCVCVNIYLQYKRDKDYFYDLVKTLGWLVCCGICPVRWEAACWTCSCLRNASVWHCELILSPVTLRRVINEKCRSHFFCVTEHICIPFCFWHIGFGSRASL